ncbi:MAG TPA: translocation/assembly module TamB domain-containing protein [Candidatus Atribacteria bacterium]|nr:translocation/assembly module TamB domain-containing protein [Candidatus Atribacteria bacterium]
MAVWGVCFFLTLGLIWFYGQKRVVDYFTTWVTSELEKKVEGEIDVEAFAFRFPNQLRVQGIRGRGKDLSFFVSKAILQWNWRFFFDASPSEEAFRLLLEEVEISSSQSSLRNLPYLSLSFLPPGEIKIKKIKSLQFSGEEAYLKKDREGKLSWGISLPSGKVEGVFWERDSLSFNFDLASSNLLFQGEILWDMKDGKVEGEVSSPYDLSFTTTLSFTEEDMVFSPLELWDMKENRCLFQGEGEISSHLVSLEGRSDIYWGEEKNSLEISGSIDTTSLLGEGEFSLRGKETSIAGEVSLGEERVVVLNIQPGFTLGGVKGEGKIQAVVSGEEGRAIVTIPPAAVKLDMFSELEGEGIFQGVMGGKGEEWEGHLTWEGSYLRWSDFLVNDPRVNIKVGKGGEIVLEGEGEWGEGNITFSGRGSQDHLSLQGNFQNIKVEQLTEGTAFPLEGWVSGEWKREEDGLIFLSLKEGELFWEDWCLGTIEKGEIEFSPPVLMVRDFSLRQGEGIIWGDLRKAGEELEGEVGINNYPVSQWWGDEKIELVLGGNIKAKGEDLSLSLFSSSWKIGEMEGEKLSLAGKVEKGEIEVEDFSCDWGDGYLSLQGKVIPYREVNLQGEIQNLEIPSYWDVEGNLERVVLSLCGPWEEVAFLLEGEGKNFFWQGEPWGNYFHLLLGGRASLPQEGQASRFSDYLDPRLLEEGRVEVREINLEQLTRKVSSYPITGITDIVIDLDTQRNQWFFHSENFSVTMQDFHFQGKLEGSYDGEDLIIDELFFQELKGGLEVGGNLKLRGKTVEGEIKGRVNRSFSISPYGVLQLKGEANISLAGSVEEPLWQGELQGEGNMGQEGEKYACFSGVQGIINGEEIQLVSGNLQIAGLNWAMRGVVSPLHCEIYLSGGGPLEIPGENIGLSRIESDMIVRVCEGKINLEGEAKIFDGWGDFTKGEDTEDYFSSLSQLEEKLKGLPLSLELTLYTGNKMKVKTRFLDLEMEGRLKIEGESGKISGEGRLEVVKGSYNLVLREIPLTGSITFSPLYGWNPQLDLQGEEKIGGYHIYLEARGPVDSYRLTLKSEPSLKEEEILSLLFLGEKDAYLSLDSLNWQPIIWKLGQFLLGEDFSPGSGFFDGIEIKFPGSENSNFYGVRWEKGIGENYFIGYTQDLSSGENSTWDFKINFDKEWSLKMEGNTEGEINWMLEFNTKF